MRSWQQELTYMCQLNDHIKKLAERNPDWEGTLSGFQLPATIEFFEEIRSMVGFLALNTAR